MAEWPLFGGWTPAYEGDPCRGGHPPQSVTQGACGRCGRAVDLRRCLCGEESHRGGLSRSMCPNRMRMDQRDAEDHARDILRAEPLLRLLHEAEHEGLALAPATLRLRIYEAEHPPHLSTER